MEPEKPPSDTLEIDVRQYQKAANKELANSEIQPSLGTILRMRMSLHHAARDSATAPVKEKLSKAFKKYFDPLPLSPALSLPPPPFPPTHY